MSRTLTQYRSAAARCRQVFAAKARDYGASWTVLRPASVTDQIFIKARRIRQIEESGRNHVGEAVDAEYVGIVNYCAIALLVSDPQMRAQFESEQFRPAPERVLAAYDAVMARAEALMRTKNADYGEAWRDMRRESLTDILLMRLVRIKQIEDNAGNTEVSEGIEANYLDMVNYALFALIKLAEAAEAAPR